MYSNEPIKFIKDRRKKPDFLCRWLDFAVIIVWTVVLAIIAMIDFAVPPRSETFFERLLDVRVQKTVDIHLLNTAFWLLIFLFIFSLISLILNTRRLKRHTDRIHKSFIFSLIGSLAGIIIYFFYFVI